MAETTAEDLSKAAEDAKRQMLDAQEQSRQTRKDLESVKSRQVSTLVQQLHVGS